jgi:hypothetical protein
VGFYSWHTRRFDEVHPPDWDRPGRLSSGEPI